MANPHSQNQGPIFDSGSGMDPKTIAIISYITLIGWIVAVVMNNPKRELASFHIRQSLGILALLAASGIVAIVPFIGWIAAVVGWLGGVILWIIGILGALQGEMKPVPFLGDKFQEFFQAL